MAHAGRDVEDIHARVREEVSEFDGILDGPALACEFGICIKPVGAAQSEKERHISWDQVAGDLDDF